MFIEADLADLLWGTLDSRRVAPGIERARDRESGAGAGFADETQDGGIIDGRLSRPVLAGSGKEPMLDGIPLGGTGGIMADGDERPEGIDQLFLKGVFPEVGVRSVVAAVVGEDEQAGDIGRAETTFAQPDSVDPDPQRRYKMVSDAHNGKTWVFPTATSADGVRWQVKPDFAIEDFLETASLNKFNDLYVVNGQKIHGCSPFISEPTDLLRRRPAALPAFSL